MVDRRLGMAEAPGSNPGQSTVIFLINFNCDLKMMLIAQNHLQLILEVGIMLFILLVFVLNLIPLSLSVVTFLSLFIAGGFTLLFGADGGGDCISIAEGDEEVGGRCAAS